MMLSGYAVLHHAVCSVFNHLFNLSKNTMNSELFIWPLHIPYTEHINWDVTYSQLGGLFVESSIYTCQHRPC